MADLESHFQITMDESNITEEVLVRELGADARASILARVREGAFVWEV